MVLTGLSVKQSLWTHLNFWSTVRSDDITSSSVVSTSVSQISFSMIGIILVLKPSMSPNDSWLTIKRVNSVGVFRKKLKFHKPESVTQSPIGRFSNGLNRSSGTFLGKTWAISSSQFVLEMTAHDFLKGDQWLACFPENLVLTFNNLEPPMSPLTKTFKKSWLFCVASSHLFYLYWTGSAKKSKAKAGKLTIGE